jgi:hypothetical protein
MEDKEFIENNITSISGHNIRKRQYIDPSRHADKDIGLKYSSPKIINNVITKKILDMD